MTTAPTPADYDELRRRVRGTQHARSIPLLVIGGLLVNYSVGDFLTSGPVSWRYGAPLAFVIIWALGKVNELRVGVGPARGDYLIAAGAVFVATNIPMFFSRLGGENYDFHELVGVWVTIVGIALLVLSRAARDWVLAVAGLAVTGAGIVMAAIGSVTFGPGTSTYGVFDRSGSILLIAFVGAALGLAGLVLYRSERSEP